MEEEMHDPHKAPLGIERAAAVDPTARIDDPPPRRIGHRLRNLCLVEVQIALPERRPILVVTGLERPDHHGHLSIRLASAGRDALTFQPALPFPLRAVEGIAVDAALDTGNAAGRRILPELPGP